MRSIFIKHYRHNRRLLVAAGRVAFYSAVCLWSHRAAAHWFGSAELGSTSLFILAGTVFELFLCRGRCRCGYRGLAYLACLAGLATSGYCAVGQAVRVKACDAKACQCARPQEGR